MTDIVMLTGNGCPACTMLKNRLDNEGLMDGMVVMNVHENSSAQSMMRSLGLRSVPVLVKNGTETLIGGSHPMEKYKDFLNAEYH